MGGVRSIAVDGGEYTLARVDVASCCRRAARHHARSGRDPQHAVSPVGCAEGGRLRWHRHDRPCGARRVAVGRRDGQCLERTVACRGDRHAGAVPPRRSEPVTRESIVRPPAGHHRRSRADLGRVRRADRLVRPRQSGRSTGPSQTSRSATPRSRFSSSSLGWSSSRLYDTRDPRYIGTGAGEYRRIVDSAIRLFALVAIAAYALQDRPRPRVHLHRVPARCPPAAVDTLDVAPVAQRPAPRRAATPRRCCSSGPPPRVEHIAPELGRHPEEGYRVVGACVPNARSGWPSRLDDPVLGGIPDAGLALRTSVPTPSR